MGHRSALEGIQSTEDSGAVNASVHGARTGHCQFR
jgi:hypothetical protein